MRLKLCCAAAIAVALAVAGCGGDDSSSGSSQATTTPAQTTTTTIVRFNNKLAKPRRPGPHPGAKIDALVIRDIRKGTGPVIHAGDAGLFDFISTNWVTGEKLEDSWARRRPYETVIDHGVVIDGWWQGIPGMRVGGRRQIVVPPSLGFTQSLVPGLSEATTYFDVVLLQVNPAQPRGLQPPQQQEQQQGGIPVPAE